jgi:hypothetical protein
MAARSRYRGLSAALALAVLPYEAFGFCRTTTCDSDFEVCEEDADRCQINGAPLFWPDLCVTFGVHEGGSPLRGISYETAERATRSAFQAWISADCGDNQHPSIGVVSLGEVVCDRIEYNHDFPGDGPENPPKVAGPNANLVVFRDEGWLYDLQTIALTTITFAVDSGEILDADIEVNSQDFDMSTGNSDVQNDFQSVMTHEIGHFFGLAHSLVSGASMNAMYNTQDVAFRTLSEDDRAGICAIYGPLANQQPAAATGAGGGSPVESEAKGLDCTGAGPRGGFSRYCGENALADGCSIAPPGRKAPLESGLDRVAAKALRPEASPESRAQALLDANERTLERRSSLGALLGLGMPALLLGLGVGLRRRRTATA